MRYLVAIILLATSAHAETFEAFADTHNITSPSGDEDNDRLSNLTEFVLDGCDPNAPDAGDKLRFITSNSWIDYTLRPNISGVRVTVEGSTNMTTWGSISLATEPRGFRRLKIEHSELFGMWSQEVDSRLSPSTIEDTPLFSSMDHTSGTYLRNSGCWGATINTTPISVWNSTGVAQRGGILISPRHVLFAKHWMPTTQAVIRFVADNDALVERTVSAVENLSGADLSVALLDSDVPSSITFAKVLPKDWRQKIPDVAGFAIPCVWVDPDKKLLVVDLAALEADQFSMAAGVEPTHSQRAIRYENVVSGDSGCAVCLVADGALVALTCWTFGGAGSGSSIAFYSNEINDAMTSLGGGYQLTSLDLAP